LRDGELVGQISRRDIIRFSIQHKNVIKQEVVATS